MKAVIVDDDMITRVGIMSHFVFNSGDWEIVGEAQDGQSALELIRLLRPQLVIADIKMPVMDGIELLKQAKKLYPGIEFIMLSSYDDFSYVKEAMKLGACDYWLKLEMNTPEMMASLQAVKEKISGRASVQDPEVVRRLPILRGNYLKELLEKKQPEEQAACRTASALGMTLNFADYYCLKLCCMGAREPETALRMNAVNGLVEEIFSGGFHGYCFEEGGDHYCIFLFAQKDHPNPYPGHYAEVEKSTRLFQEMAFHYLNLKLVVGIGHGTGISDLKSARERAQAALNVALFSLEKTVFLVEEEDYAARHPIPLPAAQEMAQALAAAGREGDFQRVRAVLLDYVQAVGRSDGYCPQEKAAGALYETAQLALSHFQAGKGFPQEACRVFSIADLLAWAQTLAEALESRAAGRQAPEVENKAIAKVQKYIQEHPGRELSLSELAQQAAFNPFYLSRLFRTVTGETLTDYINRVRIEKSKELLQHTDEKVSAICAQVGYRNYSYFCKIFKRLTGLTPLEFRDQP